MLRMCGCHTIHSSQHPVLVAFAVAAYVKLYLEVAIVFIKLTHVQRVLIQQAFVSARARKFYIQTMGNVAVKIASKWQDDY